MRHVFQDKFRVVRMPLVRFVKFKLLGQFPVDHLSHPAVSSPNTLFVLICCIRLFCDWSFRLYHHIIYICFFIAFYLFLLSLSKSLWRCFMQLSGEIQFLSKGFHFLATSKFSRVSSGFVVWIWWDVWIAKSSRIFNVSFSRTYSGFYIYHLMEWSSFYL